ncbi:MAG: ZTL protein [Myxococcales bacterium]|nr:ZTL protein [Myxococcales bacterium]
MPEPTVYVLAGCNGAGKSSIGGAAFRARGADYFDPDEQAAALVATQGLGVADAASAAWHQGVRLLERTLAERLDFAIETTLAGATIPRLLRHAISLGVAVRVWYAGLASVELSLARIRARVARGGHDVDPADVRRRYDASRLHLIELLPGLAALRLYDNSDDADPAAGVAPRPRLVLHLERGAVRSVVDLPSVPAWARPIVAAAVRA